MLAASSTVRRWSFGPPESPTISAAPSALCTAQHFGADQRSPRPASLWRAKGRGRVRRAWGLASASDLSFKNWRRVLAEETVPDAGARC
jgi:hypothetical protein